MKSQAIRDAFTAFFVEKGHHAVASASLIPQADPTLLFVNAGMVPFKETFLGTEQRSYQRATSIQRCIRAGGKHNDLENVGYTARHHTFFEMLGNFSFGDYFKQEAIGFAWEFLTQVLAIPAEKLWVTVFEEDQEAENIWLNEIGVDPTRFSRIGAKDNFWSMGETGPCGPCTEIFYDHGPEIAGGPPGTPEEDGDRYIEIWNLVFMQYNRLADGSMVDLPKPSVDTGMGLERIAAVMQGVHDNYDIDTFQHLIQAVAKLAACQDLTDHGLRVVADHIRACAFLIIDGVMPSNEGRGYVLRRIIRRAVRHGYQLGIREDFFYRLVAPLIEVMGQAYPELKQQQQDIETALYREEQQFARTLSKGMKVFEQELKGLSETIIPGDMAFRLYDTYGFPVDLTADMAREKGFTVDMEGFDAAMAGQRDRARSASQFAADYDLAAQIKTQTQFIGYEHLSETTEVMQLLADGQNVEQLSEGQEGVVILAQSPFYAESGGQVGDQGRLSFSGGTMRVTDTQKQGNAWLHYGTVESGTLRDGMVVEAHVNATDRAAIAANHSATHLLHAAMKQVLGHHVEQKGSRVAADSLRFDFSHHGPVTLQECHRIEHLVNEQIQANYMVETLETSLEEAKAMGAEALFGEKYSEQVRVLKMGGFSLELCGGTHVHKTGDIGLFKIMTESNVASGIRRIEATTGLAALRHSQQTEDLFQSMLGVLKCPREKAFEKLEQLQQKTRDLETQVNQLKAQVAEQAGGDLLSRVQEVAGINLLATELVGVDPKSARDTVDQLKAELGSGVIVLAICGDTKVSLIAGVTDDLTHRFHAGQLIRVVAEHVGGKGGGRADMAQAGGNKPEAIESALALVSEWVLSQG